MALLAQHMKTCGYDMKRFLRTIYNSQAYQREATTAEILALEEYRFPARPLRRLSAEQMWDSMRDVRHPVPDQRRGPSPTPANSPR